MTTPTTAAGRALLEREQLNARSFPLITQEAVLAIEAEARADLLDRLAAGVRDMTWAPDGDDESEVEWIDRAAVLALIEEARK